MTQQKQDDNVIRKAAIVRAVAQRLGMRRGEVVRVVDALVAEIGTQLGAGKRVHLAGLGTFDVRMYEERSGVHPRTGAKMMYPRSAAPSFRAGLNLKRRVRKGVLGQEK